MSQVTLNNLDSIIGQTITVNSPTDCYDSVGGNVIKTLQTGDTAGTLLSYISNWKFFSADEVWMALDNADIQESGAYYIKFYPGGDQGFFNANGVQVNSTAAAIDNQTSDVGIVNGLKAAAKESGWFTSLSDFWNGLESTVKYIIIGAAVLAFLYLVFIIYRAVKK